MGTRFLPKIGLSSVLFSQRPEGGDGRLIFTVSCFSFRVPCFVLSRAISAPITRSVVFFHSEYQG